MKKSMFLLVGLCFMLGMVDLFGQQYYTEKDGKFYSGFIVKSDNDTIKGEIRYRRFLQMQDYITYRKAGTEQSAIYYPKDLIGYGHSNELYSWTSTANTSLKTAKGKDKFAIAEIIGGVSYYKYYKVDKDQPHGYTDIILVIKPGEEPVSTDKFVMGFKKNFSAYLSDNKEIAKKIANKEKGYKITSVKAIIKEYNAWYKEQNPDFTIIETKE